MAARLKLVLSESGISIPSNKSVVTAKLYYYGNGASYNYNNPKGTITIDGTEYDFDHDFTTSTSAQLLATKSKTVTHNADGSKTVSVSAKFKTGVSLGTLSASATLELTTIPRVSTLTLDVDTVLADGESEVIATATKQSSSFTDILTVSLGDYSQEVESGVAFTIPEEWISAISGESATAKVKVETFNGTTSIGTKTADLTVNVPGSVVPVINDLNISEAVAAVTNAFGNRFVQNLSRLNISADAEGVYGSTIKSYSIALDGVNYIQQAFTSNVIKTAGTLDIKVKVTDSRGRTTEGTFQVDIIEYERPAITSMAYVHCDPDGSQNSKGDNTKIAITGKVYPVEGQNTKALKLKYKTTTDEVYTERVVTLSDWTFSVDVIVNNTDPSMTYEYIAELTDKINIDSPATFRVTTGVVVLSRLAGGKGVTLFGEAEEEGFVVGGGKPAVFSGVVTLNDVLKWKTEASKSPYMGYSKSSGVGTFVICSLTGDTHEEGLAIAGNSNNLMWKNNRVYGAKVLYNNTSGTTGTVTLSESAANFNMIEIIVGFSDTGACSTLKVYSPNSKTVDIWGGIVSSNGWGGSRVRYAISGKTMTASNNYKVTCVTNAHTYDSNNLYCKQVIGWK